MERAQKVNIVAELADTFGDDVGLTIVTHYSGLTMADLTDLRAQGREAGVQFKITKNTLAKRALKGTKYEQLSDLFSGPTAVAVSKDPVAAARIVHNFAKGNEKLVILGGAMGDILLSKESVETLAKMPSLDEMRAKFIALLMTPATRIATIAQAPAAQLARVTKAYSEK